VQELSIGGVNYRTGDLDVFQAYHMARKLSPFLAGLMDSMTRAQSSPAGNGSDTTATPNFWSAVGPVAEAIAEMSQEDSEYILRTCLGTVMRRGEGAQNWARLTTAQGILMFEDLKLGDALELMRAVLEDQLGPFFREALPSLLGIAVPTPSNGPA
jgi:hypothetical protein